MKSRTAMVVLTLCAAVATFGSEYEPTIASGSSPLFAASLDRAVGELRGEIPKGRSPVAKKAVKGFAAAVEDTTGMWNCTQYEGCWEMVTQGGISCDYSLCEGCPGQTSYGNYTCSAVTACGVFPTQNSGPTCSGFGSTCGTGCHQTSDPSSCNSTSSGACPTYVGQSTCSTTCHASACPTSGGTACATQWGSTCDGSYCQEHTMSMCETPSFDAQCETLTRGSLCYQQ